MILADRPIAGLGVIMQEKTNQMKFKSFIENVEDYLSEIKSKMIELIENSAIKKRFNDNSEELITIGPIYHWDFSNNSNQHLQLSINKKFIGLQEKINLLFNNAPESICDDIEEILSSISSWIEQEITWDIPASIDEAKKIFNKHIAELMQHLNILKNKEKSAIILIPDSNSLIINPNFNNYSVIAKQQKFTIILSPTILSELDKLKIIHRDNEFRKKVTSIIKRIKGLRNQGSLLSGVILNKTIKIKMIATEPNFEKTLKWLDSTNNDDRIIASCFELQCNYPSAKVALITSDINLQNKAEMADLPYFDTPTT